MITRLRNTGTNAISQIDEFSKSTDKNPMQNVLLKRNPLIIERKTLMNGRDFYSQAQQAINEVKT
jgi:hypothetical protein